MKYSLWYILLWMFTVIVRGHAAEIVETDSWVYKDLSSTTTVLKKGDIIVYQSNDVTKSPWYIAYVLLIDKDSIMVERPVTEQVMIFEEVKESDILGIARK
jgi:hypothetical protein